MSRRRNNLRIQAPPAWRARVVLAGFAVFAVVLAGRAFELQVLDREFLSSEGDKRHLRTLDVPAGRGAILDRRGEPLALSAPTESVWAVPASLLAAPDKLAELATNLEYGTSELRDRLQNYRDRKFLYLQRQLSPAHAREVKAVDAPGVFLKREYRRYYPAGEAAAQLVGLTNIDNNGQEGIELALDERLHGESGSRRVIEDAKGRVVEDLAGFTPPQPGGNVKLTIDLRLQTLAYRELKEAVAEHRASDGVAVMIDPESGEILAMASCPSFNPNNRASITTAALRNRAATDTFEPGSTMKPLVVAEALATGVFDTATEIDTEGGTFRVGNMTVHDFHDYGDVDLHRLLTKSSNIGAAKLGLRLGPERLWRAYHNYGFGRRSGVRFPGEQLGVLRNFMNWGEVETATAAYGYGVSATALQLGRAYTAIADDGRVRNLQLVRGEAAGPQFPPERVIPAETAASVRRLLRDVVSAEGTAGRAAVPGYSVIGKTGTAEKATVGGYSEDTHQALFVGMAPADDPQLLTLVMINEPKGDAYFGGLVAAPAFASIMQDALRMLRVPPDTPETLTVDAGGPAGEGA